MAEITITIKIENNNNGVTVNRDAAPVMPGTVKEPIGTHVRLPLHFVSRQVGGEGPDTSNQPQ
jgi:hypothetical protein